MPEISANLKKLILIDGNAIIHRSFHALPPFKTKSGELVNAVYGFATLLLNVLTKEKPDYIAVTFDVKAKTFRHEQYTEYKATRVKAPDELYAQIPRVRELVQAFGIPIYEMPGYEADDVLGTLAKQAEEENLLTYIVTGDLDTLQLVTEKTRIMATMPKFSEPTIYDFDKVFTRYGLTPSQITDMKGLQGDNSDNLKGVAGIGPKTARDLLQKYGSVENIYQHLDEIKESTRIKLATSKDSAFQSKYLATIICDVPGIELNLIGCRSHEYDEKKLEDFLMGLEFKTLLNRFKNFNGDSRLKRQNNDHIQASLF
ncbi:MAG: 5'-3' exonuclease H3TH domain-containing protein [Patescibacteria group bacterium]